MRPLSADGVSRYHPSDSPTDTKISATPPCTTQSVGCPGSFSASSTRMQLYCSSITKNHGGHGVAAPLLPPPLPHLVHNQNHFSSLCNVSRVIDKLHSPGSLTPLLTLWDVKKPWRTKRRQKQTTFSPKNHVYPVKSFFRLVPLVLVW